MQTMTEATSSNQITNHSSNKISKFKLHLKKLTPGIDEGRRVVQLEPLPCDTFDNNFSSPRSNPEFIVRDESESTSSENANDNSDKFSSLSSPNSDSNLKVNWKWSMKNMINNKKGSNLNNYLLTQMDEDKNTESSKRISPSRIQSKDVEIVKKWKNKKNISSISEVLRKNMRLSRSAPEVTSLNSTHVRKKSNPKQIYDDFESKMHVTVNHAFAGERPSPIPSPPEVREDESSPSFLPNESASNRGEENAHNGIERTSSEIPTAYPFEENGLQKDKSSITEPQLPSLRFSNQQFHLTKGDRYGTSPTASFTDTSDTEWGNVLYSDDSGKYGEFDIHGGADRFLTGVDSAESLHKNRFRSSTHFVVRNRLDDMSEDEERTLPSVCKSKKTSNPSTSNLSTENSVAGEQFTSEKASDLECIREEALNVIGEKDESGENGSHSSSILRSLSEKSSFSQRSKDMDMVTERETYKDADGMEWSLRGKQKGHDFVGEDNNPIPSDAIIDKYGFLIESDSNEKIKGREEGKISRSREERLIRKWREMIGTGSEDWKSYARKHPREVKRRIRKGIPDCLRGLAWQLISGSRELVINNQGVYEQLLFHEQSKWELDIMRDLNRTFPSNIFFHQKHGQGQRSLYNVLKAYSVYDPAVGYVQGMGFIAGVSLLYMGEEDAFWLLVALLKGAVHTPMEGLYSQGLPLIHQYTFQMHRCIQEFMPRLGLHLEDMGINPTAFTSQWFITVFWYSCPFPVALRIWDVFLYEGMKIVFRVGIAMIKYQHDKLLDSPFEDIVHGLQKFPEEILQPDLLLSMAFSVKISKKLEELRKEYVQMNANSSTPSDDSYDFSKSNSIASDHNNGEEANVSIDFNSDNNGDIYNNNNNSNSNNSNINDFNSSRSKKKTNSNKKNGMGLDTSISNDFSHF